MAHGSWLMEKKRSEPPGVRGERQMNDRRTFLKSVAGIAAAGTGVLRAQSSQRQEPAAKAGAVTGIHKAVLISMLPKALSYSERFAMARGAGFEAIEMQTITAPEEAAEIREAS